LTAKYTKHAKKESFGLFLSEAEMEFADEGLEVFRFTADETARPVYQFGRHIQVSPPFHQFGDGEQVGTRDIRLIDQRQAVWSRPGLGAGFSFGHEGLSAPVWPPNLKKQGA
jgi:hypothetical protein